MSADPDENYFSLRFAGGAGTYYGKSLRLNFLGNVLLPVVKSRSPATSWMPPSQVMTRKPWRLPWTRWVGFWPPAGSWTWPSLASRCRRMIEAFFQGDYDFLQQAQEGLTRILHPHRQLEGGPSQGPEAVATRRLRIWEQSLRRPDQLYGQVVGAQVSDFWITLRPIFIFPWPLPETVVLGDVNLQCAHQAVSRQHRPGRRPGLRYQGYGQLFRPADQCPGRQCHSL